MKCQICGKPTDWDSSFGYREFIICGKCEHEIRKESGDVLKFIFTCGEIRRKGKEKNESD